MTVRTITTFFYGNTGLWDLAHRLGSSCDRRQRRSVRHNELRRGYCFSGDGSVFEITYTNGTYASTPTTLYSFTGGQRRRESHDGVLMDWPATSLAQRRLSSAAPAATSSPARFSSSNTPTASTRRARFTPSPPGSTTARSTTLRPLRLWTWPATCSALPAAAWTTARFSRSLPPTALTPRRRPRFTASPAAATAPLPTAP